MRDDGVIAAAIRAAKYADAVMRRTATGGDMQSYPDPFDPGLIGASRRTASTGPDDFEGWPAHGHEEGGIGQNFGGSWHEHHYDHNGDYIGPAWPDDMAHHLHADPAHAPYNAGYHAAWHPAFVDLDDPSGEAESAWSNAGGPTKEIEDFSTFQDGWEDAVNGIPHMWLSPDAHRAYLEGQGDDLRKFNPKRRRDHAEAVRNLRDRPDTGFDPDDKQDPFDPRLIGASRVPEPGEDPVFDNRFDEFQKWMRNEYRLSPERMDAIARDSQPGGKYEQHGHINEYIREFLNDPRIKGASRRTAGEEIHIPPDQPHNDWQPLYHGSGSFIEKWHPPFGETHVKYHIWRAGGGKNPVVWGANHHGTHQGTRTVSSPLGNPGDYPDFEMPVYTNKDEPEQLGRFRTPEQAKAAAEAHYEQNYKNRPKMDGLDVDRVMREHGDQPRAGTGLGDDEDYGHIFGMLRQAGWDMADIVRLAGDGMSWEDTMRHIDEQIGGGEEAQEMEQRRLHKGVPPWYMADDGAPPEWEDEDGNIEEWPYRECDSCHKSGHKDDMTVIESELDGSLQWHCDPCSDRIFEHQKANGFFDNPREYGRKFQGDQ